MTHSPLIVDLTIEENARLKVLYGSSAGFHAIDLDSGEDGNRVMVKLPSSLNLRYLHANPKHASPTGTVPSLHCDLAGHQWNAVVALL